jgi:hypothetical protein
MFSHASVGTLPLEDSVKVQTENNQTTHPALSSSTMVCDSCTSVFSFFLTVLGQKKTGTVICPDPWKDGARNTIEGGGRKINENKMLNKEKR